MSRECCRYASGAATRTVLKSSPNTAPYGVGSEGTRCDESMFSDFCGLRDSIETYKAPDGPLEFELSHT